MSLQSVGDLSFVFLPSRPVEVQISDSPLSSDAGLLPIRQLDDRLRFTEQFAAALQDSRVTQFTRHSLLEMVRQRIYGILADYEDQNDHDTLRSDPVFKLVAEADLQWFRTLVVIRPAQTRRFLRVREAAPSDRRSHGGSARASPRSAPDELRQHAASPG